jgi:hypothetical protein
MNLKYKQLIFASPPKPSTEACMQSGRRELNKQGFKVPLLQGRDLGRGKSRKIKSKVPIK